ncbi:MAG: hypothetical protein P8075_19705 [Deltaproteobacteria bacterium]|jgi:hypothetical protein
MSWKKSKFILAMVFLSLVMGIFSSGLVLADAFVDKLVKFDGKLLKGKVDRDDNLEFLGRGKWEAPLKLRFSLFVRTNFELVPFIETETRGILGEYTVTFTVVPKTRRASYQNLRFKILTNTGSEITSSGVAAPNGSGWAIGIATDEKPFDIHISYTTERGRDLTPVPSEGSDPS